MTLASADPGVVERASRSGMLLVCLCVIVVMAEMARSPERQRLMNDGNKC